MMGALNSLGAVLNNEPSDCPVEVVVGPEKDIIVRVGCVQRDDVVGIVSTFFSRGDKDTKAKFDAVLAKSGEVTLEITTRHPH
jgi:hypothetical protein